MVEIIVSTKYTSKNQFSGFNQIMYNYDANTVLGTNTISSYQPDR